MHSRSRAEIRSLRQPAVIATSANACYRRPWLPFRKCPTQIEFLESPLWLSLFACRWRVLPRVERFMRVILGLLLIVVFMGAMTCVILANVYFFRIYEEMNQVLPEGRRIPQWKVQWLAFAISREHRRLFPRSSTRRAMQVFTTVGVVLFCSFVAIVILMNLGAK